MITFEQAQELLFSRLPKPKQTEVSLSDAVGKFLAQDILADRDYPPFNRATMDGYIVNIADINEKHLQEFRVTATILAGDELPQQKINEGEALRIMTGAGLPSSFTQVAVIPLEDAEVNEETAEENKKNKIVRFAKDFVKPQKNIAQKGEDIQERKIVLQRGHFITPSSVLTLASLGCHTVKVFAPLRVAVITTGNEVVAIDEAPKPFQIRDSNSPVLTHFLALFGITPSVTKCKDVKEEIFSAVKKSLDYDMVILAGGISHGDADYVADVLKELQVQKLFHHVRIKPGKPVYAGYKQTNDNNTLVLALPGNPMAVQTACKIFIEPLIRKACSSVPQKYYKLSLATDRKKRSDRVEFFPCVLQNNGESTQIAPLSYNGSGDVFAVSLSDGLGVMKEKEHKTGDKITFIPWSTL